MKKHNITQQAKGLKGRPSVWVDLGGSHVERPKDAHHELVEGGTGTRSPQTHTFGEFTRKNAKVVRMPARLQNRVLVQKLGHFSLGLIGGRDLNHLRVHPAEVHQRNGRRGRVRPVNSIGRIVPPYDLYLGWRLGHPDRQGVGAR